MVLVKSTHGVRHFKIDQSPKHYWISFSEKHMQNQLPINQIKFWLIGRICEWFNPEETLLQIFLDIWLYILGHLPLTGK
jgi:hypothetical protein